jgi:hypothetical protein
MEVAEARFQEGEEECLKLEVVVGDYRRIVATEHSVQHRSIQEVRQGQVELPWLVGEDNRRSSQELHILRMEQQLGMQELVEPMGQRCQEGEHCSQRLDLRNTHLHRDHRRDHGL